MLAELHEDNQRFIASLRQAHHVCDEHKDVASTSLIENYIDQAEKRAWFLYEASQGGESAAQQKMRTRPIRAGTMCQMRSTCRRRL
jgi:bacterioferritin (cytochrome b1)